MSKKRVLSPLAAAIGTTFVVGLAGAPVVNAADNPFSLNEFANGYMVADAHEGKCGGEKAEGEGKCGGEKTEGEGKCGGEKKEGEGKCGGEKKEGEGKCGGEKKEGEGKCGEAKCGGNKGE